MSKKKKKHNKQKQQKSLKILKEMDTTIDKRYSIIIDEIEDYQKRLKKSDRKAIKQQKKKLKQKMGVVPYYVSKDRIKVRQQMIEQMEKEDLFNRIEKCFSSIIPIVTIIARLIASLIIAILSFDPILHYIKPTTLSKMKQIYNVAMAIH